MHNTLLFWEATTTVSLGWSLICLQSKKDFINTGMVLDLQQEEKLWMDRMSNQSQCDKHFMLNYRLFIPFSVDYDLCRWELGADERELGGVEVCSGEKSNEKTVEARQNMYVNERDTGEKMRGVEVVKVEEFKYLGSLWWPVQQLKEED